MHEIFNADCLEILRQMPENSVDSIVTDPPYGWRFMGKAWDGADIERQAKRAGEYQKITLRPNGKPRNPRKKTCEAAGSYDFSPTGNQAFQHFTEEWAREAFRVLKPGGHALIFCGPRTYHRMACGVEDAGFEIRDQCQYIWCFGSGFPKSLDVKKSAIKQGIACVCDITHSNEVEGLRDLSDGMDAENEVSGCSEFNVLEPVRGEENQQNQNRKILDAAVSMSGLPKRVSAEVAQSSDNLLVQMPGCAETLSPEIPSAPKGDCTQHEGPERAAIFRAEKPILEGRSDVQTEQRELHRPEVRPVPEGISPDGSQGRLHNGTPFSDGEAHGKNAHPNGSGSPQGPQHAEQLHNESGMVPGQPIPQNCRRCGKAIFQDGLGTALKPANEPILLARKPLSEKTVAANVLKWGTGGINIDKTRVKPIDAIRHDVKSPGRFPSNLLLDETAAEMLDAQSRNTRAGKPSRTGTKFKASGAFPIENDSPIAYTDDNVGASRFFYVAKASKREKNAGLDTKPTTVNDGRDTPIDNPFQRGETLRQNTHPTVKPITLMRYLCRLITPPGGTVLDPFMGSGSTGIAALQEGFKFIGIEREAEYIEIARARLINV